MDWLEVAESAWNIAEIVFCVWLFARSLQPRENAGWRACTFLLAAVLVYCLVTTWGQTQVFVGATEAVYFMSQVAGFGAVIAACVLGVLFCCKTTVWNALFCATTGYVVQNLASGTHGFVMICCGYAGLEMAPSNSGIVSTNPLITMASLVGSAVVVIGTAWLLYIRRIERAGLVDIEDRRAVIIAVAVLLFDIAFDLVNKGLSQPEDVGVPNTFPAIFLVTLKLTHGAACLLLLFMQYEMHYSKRLEQDAIVERQLAHEELRQYQMSKEAIEAINARCHDIRHQIRDLNERVGGIDAETLAQIAREVDVYDTRIKTGNEALDVILTEKSLRCARENITLSCIADGEALSFMSQVDLQALFGNALDNAIEAVCDIPDSGRRSIGVVVRRCGEMVSVHVENYFAGEAHFEHGMPQSSKTGELHGYGTRSMRLAAERYGGTISWRAADGVFHVNALIPAA